MQHDQLADTTYYDEVMSTLGTVMDKAVEANDPVLYHAGLSASLRVEMLQQVTLTPPSRTFLSPEWFDVLLTVDNLATWAGLRREPALLTAARLGAAS